MFLNVFVVLFLLSSPSFSLTTDYRPPFNDLRPTDNSFLDAAVGATTRTSPQPRIHASERLRRPGDATEKLRRFLKRNEEDVFLTGGVEVALTFTLYHVIELNEKSQFLDTNFYVFLDWVDETLSWRPEDFDGVKSVIMPAKWTRKPDLTIVNQLDKVHGFWSDDDAPTMLSSEGRVSWAPTFKGRTACKLDVVFFPFEDQQCEIIFSTWFSTVEEIRFRPSKGSITMYGEKFTDNTKWELSASCVKERNHTYQTTGDSYSEIHVHLFIRRKATLEVFNIMLPAFLILLQIIGAFWLPLDSPGKPSLGMTVFLAATVQSASLNDLTPATTPFPIVGVFHALNMVVATAQVLATVVVLAVRYQGHLNTKMPWIFERFLSLCSDSLLTTKKARNEVAQKRMRFDQEERKAKVKAKGFGYLDPGENEIRWRSQDFGWTWSDSGDGFSSLTAAVYEQTRFSRRRWEKSDEATSLRRKWETLAIRLDRLFFSVIVVVYCLVVLIVVVESCFKSPNRKNVCGKEITKY